MDHDAAMPTRATRQGPTPRYVALRSILTVALLIQTAAAPPIRARIGYVIDGDTLRLVSGERIRIAGIDAPEPQPRRAKCKHEIRLGRAATARARALLDGREVSITRVGRSYHRTVARVRLDGRDLAAMLIDAGIARAWPRSAPKPDWCAT